MKNTSLLIITLFCVLSASAQTPRTLNFQGNLTDPAGTTIGDGVYPMTVRLFDVLSGGTALWTEDLGNVEVTDGIFNVKLGKINPLDPALFADSLWLEIVVNSEPLVPRIELASSAYSFSAGSLVGDNFIPNSGNVHIGGGLNVGGVAPTIDLAIDDDDTGLEVPADGTLSFYTDDIERMTLNNVGNVGIGTTTPPEKLSVSGNIAATDTVKADVFAYNIDRVEHASVHSSGFSISVNPGNAYYISGVNDGYYRNVVGIAAGSTVVVNAPISLPHGAIITALRLRVFDNDATYDCNTELIRSGTTIQDENQIAITGNSSGSGQVLSTTSINASYEKVDNYDYSYSVRIYLRSSSIFYYSASVSYRLVTE